MRRAVALLAASLLAAVPAAADVLCRARSGAVVVRTACRKRERRIDLPRGPAGQPGAAAVPSTRIVDAAGEPVGLVADPFNEDNATRVIVEITPHLVKLFVDPDGFLKSAPPARTHLKADCTDPPLIGSPPAPLVREGLVVDDQIVYVGDPIVSLTPAALEFAPSGGVPCNQFPGMTTPLPNGNCCQKGVQFDEGLFGPLTTVPVSTLGLTLPFHLEP
jgi:hypothetical protein